MKSTYPNFFIVGAPKCGTSALYHALLEHPDVYFPRSDRATDYWIHKEPLYFSNDLGIADWMRITNEDDYLKLYAGAGTAKRRGDVSALYLFSDSAARHIRQFCEEEVRIIILLRPPVDWMRSWHHDCLRYAHEPVANFRAAVNAGAFRDCGQGLPRHCGFKGCLNYARLARFSDSVSRYFECFGRERVRVFLMEDLVQDPAGVLSEVGNFLGITPVPFHGIERQNDSATLSRTHTLEFRLKRKLSNHSFGQHLMDSLPHGSLRVFRRTVQRYLPPLSDKSIDPELRLTLLDDFRSEVLRLGELIGRDLSHWNRAEAPPTSH